MGVAWFGSLSEAMMLEISTVQHSGNPGPTLISPGVIPAQRPLVHTLSLFQGLSKYQCAEILSYAVVRQFRKSELIFAQGERVCRFVVLKTGIVKHTQISRDGKKVLLRVSSCGDVLNAHDMMTSRVHTSSAQAMEKCEALVWESGQFECLYASYPQLRNSVDNLLAIQLEELEERFREVATETIARRLALLLVRLCKQVGRKSGRGLRVSMSRDELAQMTGTTQYTISRLLVQWAQQGILFADRQRIVVNDTEKLASLEDDAMLRQRHFSSFA